MKWMPTCRDTTELVSRAMDERLAFGERLAMRMHLAICRNCSRFAEQVQEMRRLFRIETGDETGAGLSDEARHRIETELQKKLES
ncbi:MAG: zf-HC2 domain-containing protein [Pseudomonadota bacterium]